MPWFIDNRQLRTAAWLIIEAIRNPIIERLEQIMGTLVTVDSDVLGALTTLSQTVDTEIGQLIAQGKLAPADVTGIQTALGDAKSQLDTAVAAGVATSPTDPTAPAGGTDTGGATPADPTAGGTVDPTTGAPVDPTAGGTVTP